MSSTHLPSTITRAVIPAAGFGTRLRPLTYAFPKELLPIGRQPVLAHVVAELRGAGITEALFVVSERKPQICAFFGEVYTGEEDNLPPLRCSYINQVEQKGSGDAVLIAREWVGQENFVVAFGDCLIESPLSASEPLRRLIATHQRENAAATVLVEAVPRERVSRYGVVAPAHPLPETPTEPFALSHLVEKPAVADAPGNLVVSARFVFHPAIFDAFRHSGIDPRGEQNLPDAMNVLAREGRALWAVPLRPGEARRDIGSFETFYTAFLRAALRDPEYGASVRRVLEEEA